MRLLVFALVLLAGGGIAQARCTDELDNLRMRVEREQKRQPTPQTVAAAAELKKTNENIKRMDEVDCYNAVARIRRALTTPPPVDAKAKQDANAKQ